MAQGMNLSRILRACHASRSLHGYIQVPQIHLPYHGNQGGAGMDLLTVGLKKNQQLAHCLCSVHAPLIARTYAGMSRSSNFFLLRGERSVIKTSVYINVILTLMLMQSYLALQACHEKMDPT